MPLYCIRVTVSATEERRYLARERAEWVIAERDHAWTWTSEAEAQEALSRNVARVHFPEDWQHFDQAYVLEVEEIPEQTPLRYRVRVDIAADPNPCYLWRESTGYWVASSNPGECSVWNSPDEVLADIDNIYHFDMSQMHIEIVPDPAHLLDLSQDARHLASAIRTAFKKTPAVRPTVWEHLLRADVP